MAKKKTEYRVIVIGAKTKGMESWFEKFTNDADAREWAIAYGKKLMGESIEFAKKSNVCYNHYVTLENITLKKTKIMERREKVNACKELARRSGQGISMDPDRWGEHMLDGMEQGLQKFLAQLPEDVRDTMEERYIEKYKEWLYAMSRCFSQIITGAGGWKPATFRRHEKTNAAEQNARKRLDEWCAKVIKRANRQERLTGWAEVERLQEKIDQLKESHEMMKEANKIVRNKKLAEVEQVDELVALGFSEENAILILHPKYDWYGQGFSSYQLSRNLADIKDAEAKMKRHADSGGYRPDETARFQMEPCEYGLAATDNPERYLCR